MISRTLLLLSLLFLTGCGTAGCTGTQIYTQSFGPTPDGGVHVVYGKIGGFGGTTVNVSAISGAVSGGVNGFYIDGDSGSANSPGLAGGRLGDVNGDGINDMLIGGERVGSNGDAYVVYGASGTRADLDLDGGISAGDGFQISGYANGSAGFRMDGATASGRLGQAVDLADVNGDNCADLLIGEPYNGDGKVYVIYGGQAQ